MFLIDRRKMTMVAHDKALPGRFLHLKHLSQLVQILVDQSANRQR